MYELVIGLEVHAQLMTSSKLFCGDATAYGAAPNSQVSPVSLALPGTLPKLNEKAIALAVRLGLALDCEIEQNNYFARKNYFYPDLPKGYQISQHTAPICKNGHVIIQTATDKKSILLNRIHIEEDAGKSIHDAAAHATCIDLNRAGVPLLEIVTEPVMHSADDAYLFLTELRKIVRWLDVCDGNMEEGSMRCDANISIRLKGEQSLGKRVEVKNLNSIRNVKKAIEIEFDRLVQLQENNQPIIQETRSFDADNQTTFSLRSKEDAEDYRYFPEPDLPPFIISEAYIQEIFSAIPVMPEQKKTMYCSTLDLSDYDAAQICNEKDDVLFFDELIKHTTHYKAAVNWFIGPIKYYCQENKIELSAFPLSKQQIAELIELTASGAVQFNIAAQKILPLMIANVQETALTIARQLNLIQEKNETALSVWIEEVLASMPEKVIEYKSGKKGLIGLFSGAIKKRSNGKADMQLVNQMLERYLNQ